MERLEFNEIVTLINLSGTTEIGSKPIASAPGGWDLYQAHHKVQTSSYPFHILYLHAKASRDSLDSAARQLSRGNVHVVYASSLDERQSAHKNLFSAAHGVWSSRDYLRMQVEREIQTYLSSLKAQRPKHWVDPRIRRPENLFSAKRPNPILSFLTVEEEVPGGRLAILLAEPGQGKTYMSNYLAAEIAAHYRLVPLAIESKQWTSMSVADLAYLSKTMMHAFRFHRAPIGWLENHEDDFLDVMLKGDLFRIIFDGFDEYVLRNAGAVQPMEALEALADLAQKTGSRIVITSRTSFWETNLSTEAVSSFVESTGTLIYHILAFDENHAENYFKNRIRDDPSKADRATQLFRQLKKASPSLVGRGFVLNLIGDLVEREKSSFFGTTSGNLDFRWLLSELCDRETERQQLPFNATEQLEMLRMIAGDAARGEQVNDGSLDLAMELLHPQMEPGARKESLEKLKAHPLLKYDPKTNIWDFKEQQIRVVFVAEQMLGWTGEELRMFIERVQLDAGAREDLGNMLVDLADAGRADGGMIALKRVIRALSARKGDTTQASGVPTDGQRLAATVALIAVERSFRQGTAHADRTNFLLTICHDQKIDGFAFSGTIGRYDFRGVKFSACFFEQVLWANCKFDDSTIFDRCKFTGGLPPAYTDGLGKAQFPQSFLDQEASAWLTALRVREGSRSYTVDDLKRDVGSVLDKFITGGVGFGTVKERNLSKGTISGSPHKGEIIGVLCSTVFEPHHISGIRERGFNVRETAKEAMKFYAANNVFTGAIGVAFDKLKRRVGV
jgi:hypothetical protein